MATSSPLTALKPIPAGRGGRSFDVLVIGAGHNGLTAAAYLAKAGLDVCMVEASPTIGGMTATEATLPSAPGHVFNEGAIQASLFRATSIEHDLGLARYGLRQLGVDPPHVHADADGQTLAVFHDPRRTAADIRRFSPKDAEAWLELARTLDSVMSLVIPYMLRHPMRPDMGRLLAAFARSARKPKQLAEVARLFTISQAEAIDERFKHHLPRGVLASMATFSWMTQDATAWALIYLGLFQRTGSSMFEGGTGALPRALAACLADHGGQVRTSAPVEELLVDGDTVTGVRLAGGEELRARAVIASCNPRTTLTELLPQGTASPGIESRAKHIPTSATEAAHIKINVALKGRLRLPKHDAVRGDGLDLRRPLLTWHTLEDHENAWRAVVRRRMPDSIPMMTTVPTATDPTQAPAGQDTLWLWSGEVPLWPETPWETIRDEVEAQLLADCSQYYDGIEELQIDREFLTPDDVAMRFNALHGNVYHVDALATRFGPLRPAWGLTGYRTPIPGLYLSGAGTHPSGGICGAPGQLAATVVHKDLSAATGSRQGLRSLRKVLTSA